MELINIISGTLIRRTVDRYPVPHLVLHDQHTQFFQLFSQILNVKTYDTVTQFHVGSMVKHF